MNIEALKKVFPEGSEISISLPVKLSVFSYDVDGAGGHLYLDASIDRSKLGDLVVLDEAFVDDIHIRMDTGIYPKAFMALIGKDANKVKTVLKKELQAQIKKLQEELDSL